MLGQLFQDGGQGGSIISVSALDRTDKCSLGIGLFRRRPGWQVEDRIIHHRAERLDQIINQVEDIAPAMVEESQGWVQSRAHCCSHSMRSKNRVTIVQTPVKGIIPVMVADEVTFAK